MKPTNPQLALSRIATSVDREWLTGFRQKMVVDRANDIIQGIDQRLDELNHASFRAAIAVRRAGSTIEARMDEAVAVYEAFLKYKHKGKSVKATHTKALIARVGHKEAVIKSVMTANRASGLDLLAQQGRLDCAYEQIVLDFASEFDAVTIAKARRNLALLAAATAPACAEMSPADAA